MPAKSSVLIGLASLCAYLGVTKPTIYKYLRLGMPGVRIGGTWHFHADHVEEFFRRQTIQREMISGPEVLDESDVFPELSSKT